MALQQQSAVPLKSGTHQARKKPDKCCLVRLVLEHTNQITTHSYSFIHCHISSLLFGHLSRLDDSSAASRPGLQHASVLALHKLNQEELMNLSHRWPYSQSLLSQGASGGS